MQKLTRTTFRLAYRRYIGDDLMNATMDHEQYLRTGEIPHYVQVYMRREEKEGKVNGVFHLPSTTC